MFVREIPTGSPNIKPFWSSNLHKLSTFWRQNIWPKHVPKFPTASPPWLAFTRTWLGFRAGSSTGRSCKTCGDAQWILGMWMAWKRWVGFNQENAGVEEYWWNINDLRTIFMEHLHGRLAGYSWNVGWYPPGFIAGKILCEWTEFFIAMLCDKLPEGSSYGFSASNFCCVFTVSNMVQSLGVHMVLPAWSQNRWAMSKTCWEQIPTMDDNHQYIEQ